MKSVQVYTQTYLDEEHEFIAPVYNDNWSGIGQSLQLIPRNCPRLETLDVTTYEIDADVVDMGGWICKNLKTPQVRVKELDTKEKILKAIRLWRKGCWRRRHEKAGTPVVMGEQGPMDNSIEARVARHLLKFDKLGSVWLGSQRWTPI